jgi:hypothetical protein
MLTDPEDAAQPDFDAIQTALRNQSEQYRERHLSVKLSLYAGFFAFEGIAVAAGVFVAAHSPLIATTVIGISFVSVLILLLHHSWFLRMYDDLGYTKISIKSHEDVETYWAKNDESLAKFGRLKPWRRFLDGLLYLLVLIQISLLAIATFPH